MKRLLIIISLLVLGISVYAQKHITTGMSGKQVRDALNSNFDSLYNTNTDLNVKRFGAIGDGVTDDATAITAAINAAKGRILRFPPGDYLIKSSIDITTDSAVYLIGNNAKIIGDNRDGTISHIGITGTQGSKVLLTNDVDAGSYYLTVNNASDYNRGDVLFVGDETKVGAYRYGEPIIVFGNNGTDSIRLMTPVILPLTVVQGAYIVRYSSNPVVISGFIIENNKYQKSNGIKVQKRANVYISNNTISGCMYAGILVDHVYNGVVCNNNVSDSWYGPQTLSEFPGGDNYGISISSCRAVDVYQNDVKEARHCIETGGYEFCRDISIHNNRVYSTIGNTGSIASISSHIFDSFISIKDNIIYGDGINARGSSLDVSGNKIYITESGNVGLRVLSEWSPPIEDNNIFIRDNEIFPLSNATGNYGIYLLLYSNDTIANLIIEGNIVSGTVSDFRMSSSETSSTVIENMVLRGNSFRSNVMAYMEIIDAETIVHKLSIENNLFNSGIRVLGDTTYHVSITDNYSDMKISANPVVITNTGNVFFDRNIINGNGDDNDVNITNCGNVIFTSNVISNYVSDSPVIFDSIVNLVNHSNSIVNCSNGISVSNITNDLSGTNYTY